jgi:hypothetical protein
MADDLMTYLSGREATGFEPKPFYSQDGDFLTFFFIDADHYADRVDDRLTVYLSMDTGELVGCKIKGVRRILDTLGRFGINLTDGHVQLSFLFLPGAMSREGDRQRRYEEIGALTQGVMLDPSALQASS